jgi:hypothetical protein
VIATGLRAVAIFDEIRRRKLDFGADFLGSAGYSLTILAPSLCRKSLQTKY